MPRLLLALTFALALVLPATADDQDIVPERLVLRSFKLAPGTSDGHPLAASWVSRPAPGT
jgi:hypothetical protein